MVVEYFYYWILHQGNLSAIDKDTQTIKVIHYEADHLFVTRTIMEDTVRMNLQYHFLVHLYNQSNKMIYIYEETLERARKRIDEQKWSSGNRSRDFLSKLRSKEIRFMNNAYT